MIERHCTLGVSARKALTEFYFPQISTGNLFNIYFIISNIFMYLLLRPSNKFLTSFQIFQPARERNVKR